ncbi:hypothetical protein BDF19DRAFT_495211 [Syncephalis fuscata]|nr:hypothetical protein BDF19DRAFT_495211 [Syncephalis fuscata]
MTDSEEIHTVIASPYAWTDNTAWELLEQRLMAIEDNTGVIILVDDATKFVEITGKDNEAVRRARVQVQNAIKELRVPGDDIGRLEGDDLYKFISAHQAIINGDV